MNPRRSHIDIQGMSCANCSQSITEAVESLDGVSGATINYATDEGSVEYDPDEVTLGRIYEAIEGANVTLMRDDPRDVVKAIRVSHATLAKIKQNLV